MLAVATVTWAIAAVATSRSRLLPMVQGMPGRLRHLGDLLRRPDAAVLAGIEAQHVGGPCRITSRASCGVKTLSSAMIGMPLRRRTSAIAA